MSDHKQVEGKLRRDRLNRTEEEESVSPSLREGKYFAGVEPVQTSGGLSKILWGSASRIKLLIM